MKVLLPVAEVGILLAFVAHVALVIRVTLENKKAASKGYKVNATKNPGFKNTTSKLMLLSGLVVRSEEHTSELQSRGHLVCRLLLEKKKVQQFIIYIGSFFMK